jgi:hypothetical protein
METEDKTGNYSCKCGGDIIVIVDLGEPVWVWYICERCGKTGQIPSFSYYRVPIKAAA